MWIGVIRIMIKLHILPEKDIEIFSILYHLTSVSAAIEILETGLITSNDLHRHANFSVIDKKPDLAKSSEVCLIFKWPHEQAYCFGDPFGCLPQFSPKFKSCPLLHIFTDEDYGEGLKVGEDLKDKNYWQSNLYPGSEGLIFEGFELNIQYSKTPECWTFFSGNCFKFNTTLNKLTDLANSKKGSILRCCSCRFARYRKTRTAVR